MEALDQKYGEGSQEEMKQLLTGSGLLCYISSTWGRPGVLTAFVGDEKPEDATSLIVNIDWWDIQTQERIGWTIIKLYDDEPDTVYWESIWINPDRRPSGIFHWIWSHWPDWGIKRGITEVRILAQTDELDRLLRSCGAVDDPDRETHIDSAHYVSKLKASWRPGEPMAEFIKQRRGDDSPSYLDKPSS